jgi:uridine phosphorylase
VKPDDAIVNPVKGKYPPTVGPLAIMVATETDLKALRSLLQLPESNCRRLHLSRLYTDDPQAACYSVTGPMMGAPYATMLLESLIVWGAQQIVFLGWCGAIVPHLSAGDIILPGEAMIEEGTSRLYEQKDSGTVKASDAVTALLRGALEQADCPFVEGKIWTTDAIYRETIEKVKYYQHRQALAVEMELSALFSVGRFRKVAVGALLVVSDELGNYQWRPGFQNERFKRGRKAVHEVLKKLCLKI